MDEEYQRQLLNAIDKEIWIKRKIRGCLQAEILEIEEANQVILPDIYRTFLSVMGKSRQVYEGLDFFYPEVIGLTQAARDLLESSGNPFQIGINAFAFSMFHGYSVMFFNCDEGPDPKVYYFCDGDKKYTLKNSRLSLFLIENFKGSIIAM